MATSGMIDYFIQAQIDLTVDDGTTVDVDSLPGDEASI
jgi:hypothetical protein